jgi:hypothetical protein
MNLEFLQEYLTPVIVGICLCIGYIVKRWIKDVDNKYIPTIVAVMGVLLALWIHRAINPTVILSGIFSGLASTGLHQLFTKLFIKKDDQTTP